MSTSELDHLLDEIGKKYPIDTVPLRIGDKVLKVLQLRDFEEYVVDLIDKKDARPMDLPFWAKIWESSFLLAYFLGRQPVALGQRMLEIGTGMGIVGIYAALCGHRVTLTDNNEDALLFARANALLNGVSHVQVRKLDWSAPDLPESFDVIFGSEVVYDRRSYPALVQFLRKAITPGGMIFLAKNTELHAPDFFVELTKFFEFKQSTQSVGSGEDCRNISLFAVRLKKGAASQEGRSGA